MKLSPRFGLVLILALDPPVGTLYFFEPLGRTSLILLNVLLWHLILGIPSSLFSGIVKEDSTDSTCTKLPITITCRLPFGTFYNKPVLLTIVMGSDVAVNFLLGISFFKQAKAIINFEANVVRVPVFRHCQGLPMSYRRHGLTVPACNPSLLGQTYTCEHNAGIDRELLGLMEIFSPGSENLVQVCGCVSALTAAAS